jgi:hypothetical protein
VVVETEEDVATAVETEAASRVEDPRGDEVVEAAAGVDSSRAQSANCVARRATMSSNASNASILLGPGRLRRVSLLLQRPMAWTQIGTWTLVPRIM